MYFFWNLINVFHKIDYNLWKNKDEVAKYKNDTIDKILKKNNQIKSYENEEYFVLTKNVQEKQQNYYKLYDIIDFITVEKSREELLNNILGEK